MKALAQLAALIGIALAQAAPAQTRVVCSTPTLRDLVQQVGGDHVVADSIMRGPENAHNVIAKPSFMMKLRRADLFVHTGLDAEPWVPLLVKGARRKHLLPGNPGNVSAAAGIDLLEVPSRGELSREHGDIHAYGNTHYLLDPRNAIRASRNIRDALKRTDPTHAAQFDQNFEALERRLAELEKKLVARMEPHLGTKVATYHRAWPYFLARFGLVKVAEVEPKPGVTPWPAHLDDCIATMRSEKASLVIVETFSSRKSAEFVAERAGGTAVVLGLEVGSLPGTDSYEKLLEYNVDSVVAALEKS